ncbi:SRPBCC domain-containing protein [Streptomyces sp. NPDC093252]|uniref:SRPBCC domain-containing protein n=1 Tax=Streptomyces sp. NPDC093252 TaxID=3154980 RepID=UPI003421DE15
MPMPSGTEPHPTDDWPTGYDPRAYPVHAYNEIRTSLPPERLWPVLTDAAAWPHWYGNARKVALQGGHDRLADRVTFTWVTFGMAITSRVHECIPTRRLGWIAQGSLGSLGYHRWDLTPTADGGSLVVTEEVQRMPLARLIGPLVRRAMEREHQNWLDGLVRVAAEAAEPLP